MFGSILGLKEGAVSHDVFNKTLEVVASNISEKIKKKRKLFFSGYETAEKDTITFSHDGKRPHISTNGLYDFLKNN